MASDIQGSNLLAEIRERLGIRRERKPLVPPEVYALDQARNELMCAMAYFDCVAEPELVDHAVYMLGAAQKKYSYMLAKAKANNIRITGLDCLFKDVLIEPPAAGREAGV